MPPFDSLMTSMLVNCFVLVSLYAILSVADTIQPLLVLPSDLQFASDVLTSNGSTRLNSASIPTLNYTLTSPLILGGSGPIICYDRVPRQYQIKFSRADYLGVLENMLRQDANLEMRSWTMAPKSKEIWKWGSCGLAVGNPGSSTIFGEFQAIAVAHLATRIADQCARSDGVVGGTVRFGFRQEFLAILGAAPSRDPRVNT